MCRHLDHPSHRRCPGGQGETRNARDRANYQAKKAAGATSAPTRPRTKPTRTRVIADTHATATGPLAPAAAAVEQLPPAPTEPQAPSVEDVARLADDVAAGVADPHSEAGQRLIAEHGSLDRAVVALGDQVTARAEMHAGVTADDIAELQGTSQHDAEVAVAIVRSELRLVETDKELAVLRARSKHGSLADRVAVAAEHNDLLRDYKARLKDARYIDAQDAYRRAMTGTHGASGEALGKLRDGYQKALSEVRPFGGTLNLGSDTKPTAAAAMRDGAQFFPADWVAASNDHGPLRAETATSRAHYVDGGRMAKREKTPIVFRSLKRTPFDPAAESTLRDGYTLDPDQDGVQPGRVRVINTSYESKLYVEGQAKPRGPGWEVYTSPALRGQSYWRRPRTRMRNTIVETDAYVKTNKDPRSLADADTYRATTIHELSHRMEHSMPQIASLEESFIRRRTTTSDGKRERQVNVSGGSKAEAGWADSFPAAYMGRDYSDSKGHEVLSVGMESLFAGITGGFVGAGKYERDDECRSFVLGLLAGVRR